MNDPLCNNFAHMTIIKKDAYPPEVIAFVSIEEATAYYKHASEQWSESYLVTVVYGPGRPAP